MNSIHINVRNAFDVRNLCRAYGVAEPRIEVSEHWFSITFSRPLQQKRGWVETMPGPSPDAPEVTPEVTPEVQRMISIMAGEMTRGEIQAKLGLKDEKHFRERYQQIAVQLGLIEMTIADKPRSSKQKYRLTEKGRKLLRLAGDRP